MAVAVIEAGSDKSDAVGQGGYVSARLGGVSSGAAVKDWSDMDRCGEAGCGEDGGFGMVGRREVWQGWIRRLGTGNAR